MRKVAILAIGALVLAIAAIAYAQGAPNTYTVKGSTNPTNAGSKDEPEPVAEVRLHGRRGEQQASFGDQAVQDRLHGHHGEHERVPRLHGEQDRGRRRRRLCPAGSRSAPASSRTPPAQQQPERPVGQVQRRPSGVQRRRRQGHDLRRPAIRTERPAQEVRDRPRSADPGEVRQDPGGTALQFDVPTSLLHPASTLTNAVKRVTSTIKATSGATARCRSSSRPAAASAASARSRSRSRPSRARRRR